jgi:uncharacterized membrane protein
MVGSVMLICLVVTAGTAHWRGLQAASERQHVLLGGMTCLLLLWLLSLQLIEGIWLHLLGVTSLTLITGWRFTVLGATLVLVAYLLIQQQTLATMPLAWLFTVLVPATASRGLAILLRRHGFRNLFVYMLGAGFGGGLLSVLCMALLALPTFWLLGQAEWVVQALEKWPFVLLLMFPEAFINGMIITAFTVFYPDVVKTFDDDYYLNN